MTDPKDEVPDEVEELPQDSTLEPSASKVIEIPISTEEQKVSEERVEKPKPKARGKRGPDKTPRAKPKPKARTVRVAPPAEIREESSEEDSGPDEATMQELHSLNLIRSIRAYDSQRHARKQQLYASWFGR